MHFRIPCSKANDIPKVDFPVPGQPLIITSCGRSDVERNAGALKLRRCLSPPARALVSFMHKRNKIEMKTYISGNIWNPSTHRMKFYQGCQMSSMRTHMLSKEKRCPLNTHYYYGLLFYYGVSFFFQMLTFSSLCSFTRPECLTFCSLKESQGRYREDANSFYSHFRFMPHWINHLWIVQNKP